MADALRRADEAEEDPVLLGDAIDALSEGFALFGQDGALVLSNPKFREIHAPLADMLRPGLAWQIFLREAQVRGVVTAATADRIALIESRLEPGSPSETLEFEMPGERFGSATLSATKLGGIVLTVRDVTARRQVEAREREADQLLRRVLEACPANVVMSRIEDGEIIYRSPAATELLGPRRKTREYFASRTEQADLMTAFLPDGRVDAMQVTCNRHDGSQFPASISARMIFYRGEDVVVSTIVDLTHEMEMQAQLAAQREAIYQNEKMSALGELLAGVAHELNNPLSVVVGHALMLREEAADPEVVRRIEKIGQAAERCAGIVKSFLAMARQEPSAIAPVDAVSVVRTAIEAFEQGPSGGHIAIDVNLPDAMPLMLADADQISQVLINLLTNADQAIRAEGTGGTVRISAQVIPRRKLIEIRVSDDGPGVPDAIRGRIFDPLFTTKDVGQGTGIGLAFCHRVATSHNGEIRLEPGSGGGATFVLRLPVAAENETSGEADEAAAGPVRKARLLVVDDEPDVAEMIRDILVRDGFEVDYANSAERALEMLDDADYGLVLTDLNMPGIGGRGFFDVVVESRDKYLSKLVFVTGDTMSQSARQFLDTAGRPFLEKPVSPKELRALARDMLQTGDPS